MFFCDKFEKDDSSGISYMMVILMYSTSTGVISEQPDYKRKIVTITPLKTVQIINYY